MDPLNFCYWLQGFFEVTDANNKGNVVLSGKQVDTIQEHLQLVFKKVTGQKAIQQQMIKYFNNGFIRPNEKV